MLINAPEERFPTVAEFAAADRGSPFCSRPTFDVGLSGDKLILHVTR